MRKIALILMVILSVAMCSTAMAKNITVTGKGVSETSATSDALRSAVEQAVGVLIDSQTVMDKNVILKDEIYANSKGFVNQFKILKTEYKDNLWNVTINADVDTNPDSKLMNELTRLGLINVLRNPRIAVIIPEYHLRRRLVDPAGETAVIKELINAGFNNLVDIDKDRVKYNNPFNLSMYDLEQLSGSLQADIIIIGEAFSEYVGDAGRFLPGNQRTNVASCRARLEAKMYIARTGQIIAADGKYGSGADISEAVAAKVALTNAGAEMGRYMSEKLLEQAAGSKQQLELIVSPGSVSKLTEVESVLRELHGVKNVNMRSYANGKGTFALQFGGSPQALYNLLVNNLECNIRLDSSSYNVLSVTVW